MVTLQELLSALEDIRRSWSGRLECCDSQESSRASRVLEYTGRPGRPCVMVQDSQLIGLRQLGLSWSKIGTILGISRRTLYDRRLELDLLGDQDPMAFTSITDGNLDATVRDIKDHMPHVGIRMTRGGLESRGIHVPEYRIRESLQRVDPVNSALRWACPISRRIYSVPHPNALWHLDGNHKLIWYV